MVSASDYRKLHSDFAEELNSQQKSIELFQVAAQQLSDDFQSLKLEIAEVSKRGGVGKPDGTGVSNASGGQAHTPDWSSRIVAIVRCLHDAEASLRVSTQHLQRLHVTVQHLRPRTINESTIAEAERQRKAFLVSAERNRDHCTSLRYAISDYIQCITPTHPTPAQELQDRLASPVFSTIAAAGTISDISLSQLRESKLTEKARALVEARDRAERPKLSRLAGEQSLRDVLSQRGRGSERIAETTQNSPGSPGISHN